MTRWAAFVGLTALVISVLLVLASATHRLVDADPQLRGPGQPSGSDEPTAGSGTVESNDTIDAGGDQRSEADPPQAESRRTEADTTRGNVETLSTGGLVANVVLTQGLVAVVVLAGAWYFSVPAEALGVTADSASVGSDAVLTGFVLGIVLWGASESLTRLVEHFGFGADERLRTMLAPGTIGGWAALLGIALPIVAISEELLFRAAAIGVPAFGMDTSPWALALVSSIAFAFCHGIQGRAGVFVTGVLGFALAGAYIQTGSLLVVIVAHYTLNATEFLVHEGPIVGSSPA